MNPTRGRLSGRILAAVLAALLAGASSAESPDDTGSTETLDEGFGTFLLVPAGLFLMGDNFDEGDGDEVPVHPVTLSAFFVARSKVTNADFARFIAAGGYSEPSFWTAGGFGEYGSLPRFWEDERYHGGGTEGGGAFPVVGVSWFEAAAYCSWVSAETRARYRLPTEAEWEKAARGTDQRRFPWGEAIDGSFANYEHSGDPFEPGLTPVGYFDGSLRDGFQTNANVSAFGAEGMAGNVWEWCSDWYGGEYYSTSQEHDPTGPETGSSKVLRGGGWVDSSYYHRAANRNGSFPENRNPIQGFRCVRER